MFCNVKYCLFCLLTKKIRMAKEVDKCQRGLNQILHFWTPSLFRCRKVLKFRDISRMCSGKTQEVILSLEVSPECWRWVCSMELPLEPILWLSYYYTHEYNARSVNVITITFSTLVAPWFQSTARARFSKML